jgi:hypothetical protein
VAPVNLCRIQPYLRRCHAGAAGCGLLALGVGLVASLSAGDPARDQGECAPRRGPRPARSRHGPAFCHQSTGGGGERWRRPARVSLGTRMVAPVTALAMSAPATRSANSGSSPASRVSGFGDGTCGYACAARRSCRAGIGNRGVSMRDMSLQWDCPKGVVSVLGRQDGAVMWHYAGPPALPGLAPGSYRPDRTRYCRRPGSAYRKIL